MMIERPDGAFMGPFNAKAIEPLIQEGKIPPRSKPFPVEELALRKVVRKNSVFSEEVFSGVTEIAPDLEVVDLEEDEQSRAHDAFEEQIEEIRREAADKIAELTRTVETLETERDKLKVKKASLTAAEVAKAGRAEKLETELASGEVLTSIIQNKNIWAEYSNTPIYKNILRDGILL